MVRWTTWTSTVLTAGVLAAILEANNLCSSWLIVRAGIFFFLPLLAQAEKGGQTLSLQDLLAALGVIINGLPQGLLALSFGFAALPTSVAFFIGAAGALAFGLGR